MDAYRGAAIKDRNRTAQKYKFIFGAIHMD